MPRPTLEFLIEYAGPEMALASQIAERRSKAIALNIAGTTESAIARALGVSRRTINRDIQTVIHGWIERDEIG